MKLPSALNVRVPWAGDETSSADTLTGAVTVSLARTPAAAPTASAVSSVAA